MFWREWERIYTSVFSPVVDEGNALAREWGCKCSEGQEGDGRGVYLQPPAVGFEPKPQQPSVGVAEAESGSVWQGCAFEPQKDRIAVV